MTRRACFLALGCLLLSACGRNSAATLAIGDVVADPARYGDQQRDSTGEITVLTGSGLPAKGSELTVRGTVLSGATIGGEHYGTSLREQEREYPD
jgi:hypothetical protein